MTWLQSRVASAARKDGEAVLSRDKALLAGRKTAWGRFGVRIGNSKFRRFNVQPAQYKGRDYAIEPDASAASYFFAAAARACPPSARAIARASSAS